MNFKILLTSFIVLGFASCSTSYKVTQTPDDVYYSPMKEIPEDDSYVQNEKKDEYRYNDRNYGYEQWDDRRLRLRCQSRFNRWSTFDDYSWNTGWHWSAYDWRYNIWTDTWYPVNNCSCYSGYYGYNHWTYFPSYYRPVYASSPKPRNDSRWLNTNYNSANYGSPNKGGIKDGNYNNSSYGLDKPKNRTSDGSSKRSFSIPSSSSSGSSSGSSSSGSSSGKSGSGRAFRN